MSDGVRYSLVPINDSDHWNFMVVDHEQRIFTLVDSLGAGEDTALQHAKAMWHLFRDEPIPSSREKMIKLGWQVAAL